MKMFILLIALFLANSLNAQTIKMRKADASERDTDFNFVPYNYPKVKKRTPQSISQKPMVYKVIKRINRTPAEQKRIEPLNGKRNTKKAKSSAKSFPKTLR